MSNKKTYKIWATIEEHNEETDEHRDLEDQLAEVGHYDTLQEARDALNEIDMYPG